MKSDSVRKSKKIHAYLLKTVNIKVFGGEAGPAATLAPKLGPLGLVKKKKKNPKL